MNVFIVNYSFINLGSEKIVLTKILFVSSSFSSKYLFLSVHGKKLMLNLNKDSSSFSTCISQECLLDYSSYFHNFQYSAFSCSNFLD